MASSNSIMFDQEDIQNSKDNVLYTEDPSEIPVTLIGTPKIKYPSNVIFWGRISMKGLILSDGSINFTEWLQNQHRNDKCKRMYITDES
ncbi:unnamed protein product [Rotaria sordida]|uniref:Uncharacterized protein n=1 Tax=Rotaria sordida TaxID=392033 RepID=A0A814WJ20_9BILA|nr:unnamed protein product [Rotaria sordida]